MRAACYARAGILTRLYNVRIFVGGSGRGAWSSFQASAAREETGAPRGYRK